MSTPLCRSGPMFYEVLTGRVTASQIPSPLVLILTTHFTITYTVILRAVAIAFFCLFKGGLRLFESRPSFRVLATRGFSTKTAKQVELLQGKPRIENNLKCIWNKFNWTAHSWEAKTSGCKTAATATEFMQNMKTFMYGKFLGSCNSCSIQSHFVSVLTHFSELWIALLLWD